jgi:pilus assembly protein CpaC
VEPVVSDVIGSSSTGLPVTNVRNVKTIVRVAKGETAVIGGLKVSSELQIIKKVPLVSAIPILGALFKRTDKQVVESEITVLITPSLWQPPGDVTN